MNQLRIPHLITSGIIRSRQQPNQQLLIVCLLPLPKKYSSTYPSIQLKSDWVDRTFLADTTTGSFQPLEQQGFAHRTIFSSFNLGMNTKLYGLFPIKIGSIHSIMHVASPTIGYSYSPDYTKPLFGMDLGLSLIHI